MELVANNSVWIPYVGKYGREAVMRILGGVLVRKKMFNGNSATWKREFKQCYTNYFFENTLLGVFV